MTTVMRRRSLTVLTSLAMVAALVAAGALPALAASVVIVESGGTTVVNESLTTDTFTVALDTAPTGTVVVTVQSGDIGEATVSPATLTFDGTTWATAQTVTVTGVDDDITDGDIVTTISLTPDGGHTPGSVSVTTTDDEVAGVTVGAVSGSTTEAGGTATFTAVLAAKPTADVTVSITPSDLTEVTASGPLTFTNVNWATPQPVTLTGVDDDVVDGTINYTVNLAASGGGYAGVTAQVSGSTTDNDTAGITVTPTSGLAVTEASGTDTFAVVLTSEPTADVDIAVSSPDTTEATVDKATLKFTAVNWDTAQTVTVTGVDDAIDDGNQAFTIVLGAATSTDTNYNGMNPTDVTGVNADNDVTPTPPPASETFSDLEGLSQETLDAIDTLVELGITKGTSETTYSPFDAVTRWQMALFVARQLTAHGVALPTPSHQGFTDLTGLTQETIDAISQIAALNVTTGTTETTYSPSGEVNRSQMALFMTRVLTAAGFDLPVGDGSEFTDIGGLDPATQVAIRQLAELGVVFGTGNDLFSPAEPVSRWQMALFIVRTLGAAGDLPA